MDDSETYFSETENNTSFNEWSKSTIFRLKNSNLDEKSELQRLNTELKKYLVNVQVLEEVNTRLVLEIENERGRHVPILKHLSDYNEKLTATRLELEKNSSDLVEKNLIFEENQDLILDVRQRINFLEYESSKIREKIPVLESELSVFENFKEDISKDVHSCARAVRNEKEKIANFTHAIEKSRKELNHSKSLNKRYEFEIETLKEELAFRKEIHKEELEETRKNVSNSSMSTAEIEVFYKNELARAIHDIRNDFNSLNQQRLQAYKKYKEEELPILINLNGTKNEIKPKPSRDNSRDSEPDLSRNNLELKSLKDSFSEKQSKLTCLENGLSDLKSGLLKKLDDKESEIDILKHRNENLMQELDYWQSNLRSKLENEIQTFRSILNCQYLIMQENSAEETSIMLETLIARKIPPRVIPNDSIETIEILKQIFNYFDW